MIEKVGLVQRNVILEVDHSSFNESNSIRTVSTVSVECEFKPVHMKIYFYKSILGNSLSTHIYAPLI